MESTRCRSGTAHTATHICRSALRRSVLKSRRAWGARFGHSALVESGRWGDAGMVAWAAWFVWRGHTGSVQVECIPNNDPAGYGTVASDAFGFPVCTPTVRYPRRGYNAMFGWVQLVRSTDNQSGGEHFEMDPFALFGDVRSPYCWYGTEPTLFDAPLGKIERRSNGSPTAFSPPRQSTRRCGA